MLLSLKVMFISGIRKSNDTKNVREDILKERERLA